MSTNIYHLENKLYSELSQADTECSFCKITPLPCVQGQPLEYEFESWVPDLKQNITVKDQMTPAICHSCIEQLSKQI